MTITSDGRIHIVGNDGSPNAAIVSPAMSANAIRWTLAIRCSTAAVSMPFNSIQTAKGDGTTADMVAYDSLVSIRFLGRVAAINRPSRQRCAVPLVCRQQRRTIPAGEERNIADRRRRHPLRWSRQSPLRPAGQCDGLHRTGEQAFVKPMLRSISITLPRISGLASLHSSLAVSRQDESAPSVLSSFIISDNGLIGQVLPAMASAMTGSKIRLAGIFVQLVWNRKGQNMSLPA